ncbi:hypothetical protein [Ornithinimicrobium sp. INDO-MA30-4]|uniref:hypothetical protein n=1 Tax=Ornithinimicrobium sp. INDO-MA30-4 TaxID=2908651 RepID=UPI001F3FB2E1|nr:hypothetical protein [Ornithinimicrobium sp. INDO-MA30-4]UJH69570.1 hypothetical protein L0A91_09335 [Ornithinimicrobium sp. INDO-MA30-4]
MAKVRNLSPGTQRVDVHPTEVDAFYQVVEAEDGTKYLHISTFGSDSRKSAPKMSQAIQLDAQTARELVAVIQDAFWSSGAKPGSS